MSNDLMNPGQDFDRSNADGGHVYRPPAALDPKRMEFLWELANRITDSSLVPESLRSTGPKEKKEALPRGQVVANVFFVVEQADRWNMSPFALISCAAIVQGKLGFEGKVIAAVLEANFGVSLEYSWTGEGENMQIQVIALDRKTGEVLKNKDGTLKEINGTVSGWRTTGTGNPWVPRNYPKMLAYRGAREWARLYKPAAIMGVLSDDDLFEIEMEQRAQAAVEVRPSLRDRISGGQSAAATGFDAAAIQQQIAAPTSQPMAVEPLDDREAIPARQTEQRAERTKAKAAPAADPPARTAAARLDEILSGMTTRADVIAAANKFSTEEKIAPADQAELRAVTVKHMDRVQEARQTAASDNPDGL